MHSIQTSGNDVRNTTTDEYAGVAVDELVDPRPYAELVRQWSTFHPEFAYLPRKFKIAFNAATEDRAAIQMHDIGIEIVKNAQGEIGFRVLVGGGLGRTPILGSFIREFLPWQHLLTYIEAILRAYNQYGRRDNKFKARIKILLKATGVEEFARMVEEEWADLKDGLGTITDEEFNRIAAYFTPPAYQTLADEDALLKQQRAQSKAFDNWMKRNVKPHKVPGYAIVVLSLKKPGVPPGDATAEQMDFVADLADRYSFSELRVTHEQNLVLADVRQSELFKLWEEAKAHQLATPNIGLLTDVICCPGGDFCSLANAKSIPIAAAITERFEDIDFQHDIGEIELNMSGCINACGHHHIGNIGILGVDKDGSEWYQISIGGAQGNESSIGKIIGPSFSAQQVPGVIDRLLQVYVRDRVSGERFIDTVRRIGMEPFKQHVYASPVKGGELVGEDEYA
jgi:sulfite reductase (NADPH) hemoprotein beta-component